MLKRYRSFKSFKKYFYQPSKIYTGIFKIKDYSYSDVYCIKKNKYILHMERRIKNILYNSDIY